jgi:sugar/nucleoside kinase (ribokinase family)
MAWIRERNPVAGDALSSAFLAAMVVAAHLSPALALAVLAWHRSAELPGCLAERRRAEEALRARE